MAISLLPIAGCKHYVGARTYVVEGADDPRRTFRIVREVVVQDGYRIESEDPSAGTLRVRAHADENDASRESFVDIVIQDGSAQFLPAGSMVKTDGSVHPRLASEIAKLERQVTERMGAGEGPASREPVGVPVTAPRTSGPVPSATGGLPSAWNEGDFTCVPVKLPADARGVSIKLSNNEEADVSVVVDYAAGRCQARCRVPDGCPALGLGDSERVAELALRIEGGQVASQATLVLDGRPVSTVDLRTHGAIIRSRASSAR